MQIFFENIHYYNVIYYIWRYISIIGPKSNDIFGTLKFYTSLFDKLHYYNILNIRIHFNSMIL